MSSPTASTASLISNSKKGAAPPKDYAATFADLQSTYGAGGHAPVLPGRDPSSLEGSKKPKKQVLKQVGSKGSEELRKDDLGPTSSRGSKEPEKDGLRQADIKCAEITRAEKTDEEAKAEGQPQISASTTKDYESALASLQSSFGFGGSAPVVPRR